LCRIENKGAVRQGESLSRIQSRFTVTSTYADDGVDVMLGDEALRSVWKLIGSRSLRFESGLNEYRFRVWVIVSEGRIDAFS